MKKLCILLFGIFCFENQLFSQDQHDNFWIFGGRGYKPEEKQGGTVINFQFTPPQMLAKDIRSELVTSSRRVCCTR
jgi:hypothetical protein